MNTEFDDCSKVLQTSKPTWILLHDVKSLNGSRRQHGRKGCRETISLTRQTLQERTGSEGGTQEE